MPTESGGASGMPTTPGGNLLICIIGRDVPRSFIGYAIERRLDRKPIAAAFAVKIRHAFRKLPQGVAVTGDLISGLCAGEPQSGPGQAAAG